MKKDYYEILGIGKSANQEEIKRLSASWRISIIPIKEEEMPVNLKKRAKLTAYCPMRRKGPNTTLMERVGVEEARGIKEEGLIKAEVSAILISRILPDRRGKAVFRISTLAIFSATFWRRQKRKN